MLAIFNIRVKTIHLQKPVISADGEVKRIAVNQNTKTATHIFYEDFLRRLAYKNTRITINESFFDDSDMLSDYFLVVVYCKKTLTPLLSGRYYYNIPAIIKCLKGEADNEYCLNTGYPEKLVNDKLFLADRLSGNINSAIYRRYRTYIYLLFYWQILIRNRNRQFILMAREEKGEKLLKKYLKLGLKIIGSTVHKGTKHWVLYGSIEECYKHLKMTFIFQIIFRLKILFYQLNKKQ